jgi:hypothetical protein
VIVFVCEELLVTKLKQLRVLVINIIDILIQQIDSLAILLQDNLRSLDLTFLIEVWNH